VTETAAGWQAGGKDRVFPEGKTGFGADHKKYFKI